MLGRVLGVADFLDALTSDRSYRKGPQARRGAQYGQGSRRPGAHSAVVKAALELHERGELALPSEPNPDVTKVSA